LIIDLLSKDLKTALDGIKKLTMANEELQSKLKEKSTKNSDCLAPGNENEFLQV
jgi:cell division septum initiation protein DivIVA